MFFIVVEDDKFVDYARFLANEFVVKFSVEIIGIKFELMMVLVFVVVVLSEVGL